MPEPITDAEIGDLMTCAAREVLETMFFTEVLGPASPDGIGATGQMITEMTFHGSPSGLFQMALRRSTARSIAATFLGEEEADLSADQIESVSCELLNMIAGAALSNIEREVTFVLSEPRVIEPTAVFPREQAIQCSLELETGFLSIAFSTQEPT